MAPSIRLEDLSSIGDGHQSFLKKDPSVLLPSHEGGV